MRQPAPDGSTVNIDLVAELAAARVLAIIRGTDTGATIAAGSALLAGGIRLVEVSLTTPGALRAIEALRAAAPPGARVGAGTVLSATEVADVMAAGAQFVVTPSLADSVPDAVRRGVPVVAGALTPTEVQSAVRMGAAAVKLFPASLGGPTYLKALRDPFPRVPFVAVGGVGLDEMAAFLAVGAVAVGVGGPLVGDAASGGDLAALRRRTRAYVAAAARSDRA